jgi:hypothetical protein
LKGDETVERADLLTKTRRRRNAGWTQGEMTMNMNANEDGNRPSGGQVAFDIRHLTEAQLAQLGVSQIAYVRQVVVDGAPGFAIHAADGTPMAVAGDRDVAVAAILQHEMVPALVH